MNEYKYSNGLLYPPEWKVHTNSQKDGDFDNWFFTEKEAEKKYYEWKHWGDVSMPIFIKRGPPIPCTEALTKILEEGKVYTEELFFTIGVENEKLIADVQGHPVILNKGDFQFHSTLKDTSISTPWHYLWHEVQVWYGDIQKKETEEEFIRRMQKTFSLTQNNQL